MIELFNRHSLAIQLSMILFLAFVITVFVFGAIVLARVLKGKEDD